MIKTYRVQTESGKITKSIPQIDFLTEDELGILNNIGHSLSCGGEPSLNRAGFLNSLERGQFLIQKHKVVQSHLPREYTIVWVMDEEYAVPTYKPLEISKMDFSRTIQKVTKYIEAYAEGVDTIKDIEKYFFEDVVKTIYGYDIFNKLKGIIVEREEK